jgi:hypothetical protein
MVALIIFVAIILVALLVFVIMQRNARRASKEGWTDLLENAEKIENFNNMLGIKNFETAMRDLLIPAKVNFIKFNSNLLYLLNNGEPVNRLIANAATAYFSVRTPSIRRFGKRHKRPTALSLWFIAAFPDVADWGARHRGQVSLFEGLTEATLDQALKSGPDSDETMMVYGRMLHNYQLKVRARLETQ